jgi:hypothetical protein
MDRDKEVIKLHEDMLNLVHRAAGDEKVEWTFARLVETIEDTRYELEYLHEQHRDVIDEKCPSDEKHCGCVYILRREIARLRNELEGYKRDKLIKDIQDEST